MRQRVRSYEWLVIAYYTYVAVASLVRIQGAAKFIPLALACAVTAVILILSVSRKGKSPVRDWIPLAFTFGAFREMNFFTPAVRDHHLENLWIVWDRWLLDSEHLRAAIESVGPLIPSYLEICYVLVYAVALVSALVVLLNHRPENLNTFWFAYIAGTYAAYALFPYFPSDPPRTVFAGADLPTVLTVFRRFNLAILGQYGIHSSVFPSAHVSSSFACAWGLLIALPDRKRYGLAVALFSLSVAIATVYGRYHFAVDAVAGFAVSFFAWFATLTLPRRVY